MSIVIGKRIEKHTRVAACFEQTSSLVVSTAGITTFSTFSAWPLLIEGDTDTITDYVIALHELMNVDGVIALAAFIGNEMQAAFTIYFFEIKSMTIERDEHVTNDERALLVPHGTGSTGGTEVWRVTHYREDI